MYPPALVRPSTVASTRKILGTRQHLPANGSVGLLACGTYERELNNGYDEREFTSTETNEFLDSMGYGNIPVTQPVMSGAMGPVSNISGSTAASGYQEADYGLGVPTSP